MNPERYQQATNNWHNTAGKYEADDRNGEDKGHNAHHWPRHHQFQEHFNKLRHSLTPDK